MNLTSKGMIDQYNKENARDSKKLEGMREVVHKAVSREASDMWRKHVPVYGWIQMNYPSGIKPSLIEKYNLIEQNKKDAKEKDLNKSKINTEASEYSKKVRDDYAQKQKEKKLSQYYEVKEDDDWNKHKDRLFPELVNENVMIESNF
jgi:hypothetical protein